MSTFVKICGLRDAASVAAAVAAGADAIGFVFAESVRRIDPAQARRVAAEIPAHVQRVAVMRHPTRDEWQAVRDEFAPDVLQTDVADFAALDVPTHISRWPVIRESAAAVYDSVPEVFVYEGMLSGAGTTVDWMRAADLAANGRMLLAGGLDAGNVAAAITTAKPWGVDVSSGVESRPGEKDGKLIQAFIGAVRTAEKEQ